MARASDACVSVYRAPFEQPASPRFGGLIMETGLGSVAGNKGPRNSFAMSTSGIFARRHIVTLSLVTAGSTGGAAGEGGGASGGAFGELSLLYGLVLPFPVSVSASLGPALASGRGPGLAFQVEGSAMAHRPLGVGLRVHGNINAEQSYTGLLVLIRFGRVAR